MNRRIFLGSLFTAALVPEALAGKRAQPQASPSKSPPAKSQPSLQRGSQKAAVPTAQRSGQKGSPQTAERANPKGSPRTAQRANQKGSPQTGRSNAQKGATHTAQRNHHRDSPRTVERPASRPVAQVHSPAPEPPPEVSAGRPYYLSLHHTHTDEVIEIAYRIGPLYQRSALRRLNYFLRDYRTDEVAFIDPRLYDLLYLIQQRTGNGDSTFEIVSAYRSIETNEELRRVSSHVARNSLHMSGQALDIRLQHTNTRSVRNAAIELASGGVGFYPGADFVHIDTGEVRYWGA